jgi:hypothetical protein
LLDIRRARTDRRGRARTAIFPSCQTRVFRLYYHSRHWLGLIFRFTAHSGGFQSPPPTPGPPWALGATRYPPPTAGGTEGGETGAPRRRHSTPPAYYRPPRLLGLMFRDTGHSGGFHFPPPTPGPPWALGATRPPPTNSRGDGGGKLKPPGEACIPEHKP